VILFDESFEILAEQSLDTLGYPILFHIDSDNYKTVILGFVLGPPRNELFYLKYLHNSPFELPPIVFRQSTPSPLVLTTSMKLDHRSGNMLVFSYTGITILDSNLVKVQDYLPVHVLTQDHGHVLGVDDFYYSHGARDSAWDIAIRRLVVHKYDTLFNILAADTLGWSGQDNYPFIGQSIDYRNDEIVVGGHLDGPFNSGNAFTNIKKFYLAKYDKDLKQIWYREYGGDKAYWLSGLHIREKGGVLVYGYITDTIDGLRYAYIMKVSNDGEILSTSTYPIAPETPIKVVNPGEDFIQVLNPENIEARFAMYDLSGRILFASDLQSGISEFQASQIPQGIYFYTIFYKGNVIASGKWVKGY
jgi:hypothetical protein